MSSAVKQLMWVQTAQGFEFIPLSLFGVEKDPKNLPLLWIIWLNNPFFFPDFGNETKRPLLIKNPDLGFSIERHPYVWSQTEDSEPGGKKKSCMGGQGYHHVVTEKRVFGQSVFSFYKMYIIHTFFQRFERLFQCKTQFGGSSHCLNLIIYNLVTQLLQKTENKFHRRLSAICCK